MAVPAPPIPFLLRLADGRAWGGAEFPGGFVCVYHPDQPTQCTVAVSLDALLADLPPGHQARGAAVEQYSEASVQCWHTEADSPCDWDACRQPDRLAAGDRGTDPARR
ncbi:hypothetical protein DMH12_04460 [Streptomyces sp. WAC 04229]|uniref:hypothetical protein n=1 Tax=Streptomyces sp. WAC 04229 TaxID=2203206 RepID=UPI000F73A9D1|nr:hypothetical protein [Streptomyces sp. WAC 04229]RSN64029.1 hypothetical protein DMH12_04460 [Streptomyces sp. WAC 04229]